jgi:bifunctional non-homologous end joining protein LigD
VDAAVLALGIGSQHGDVHRHRCVAAFCAFDLLWLDGRDLLDRPLIEREALLRKLLLRRPKAFLYVDHVSSGTDLFRVICERDTEGIVAKQATARYTPDATTWVKIKNKRHDFFDRRRVKR